MAYIGTPIANGDGSYTFQQEDGEPLVLRGESAERAFRSATAVPDTTRTPLPANEAMEQAYAPPEDLRTADVRGAPLPFDPSVIRGFNKQDEMRQVADVQNSTARATDPAGYAAAHTHGSPATVGSSGSNFDQLMSKPYQNPTEPQEPAGGAKGAVFFRPQSRPGVPSAGGGGGGGPLKVGKPIPVAQTIQGQTPLTDEQMMADKRAQQGRYEAAEQVTEAESNKAREQAAVFADTVKMRQDALVDMQARESERQRVIGEKLAKIDQMAQEQANEKIHGFWEDKSAETKFGLAILQGVSAWAEARGGGKAYAIQQVNDAIDHDYKVQAANIDKKRADLAAQTNLLGHLRQEFGDQDAAKNAFYATKLATAGAQLEEINARNLPEEQKAHLAEFAAGLNADYTQRMQNAGRMAFSRSEKFPIYGGAGAPTQNYVNNDGSFLDLEDGTAIKASSPEMASQWREQLGGIEETEDAVRALRAELKKGPSVQNANKVKILVNNIATSAGAAKLGTAKQSGMGELRNIEEYLGQTGNVTSDVLGRTAGALDAVEASVKHVKRRIFGAAPRYSDAQPNGKGGLVRFQMGRGVQPEARGDVRITPAGEESPR